MPEKLKKAMAALRAAWRDLEEVTYSFETDESELNEYIEEGYPFDRSLNEVDVVSWCSSTIEAIENKKEAAKESALKEAKAAIADLYAEAQKWEKPDPYKVGGTYYGSTQLYSVVGNALEHIEGGQHTSYEYAGRTYYKDVYAVRIGGAYEEGRACLKELLQKLKALKEQGGEFSIIDDYGTNFSTVGIGRIVH